MYLLMKRLLFTLLCVFGSYCFIQKADAQCLTSSTPNNDCTYGDAINSFTLNSIAVTGNNGCSNTSTGYSSFTSPVWTLTRGQSYNFSINVGINPYDQGVGIWIDLNNNGQYDATEMVYASPSSGYSFSGTITIPSTATVANNVRMRIMCAMWVTLSATDACTSYLGAYGGYGEIEDYYINIVPPCPVAYTAQPQNRSVCSGSNTTFSVTASNVDTFKWEVSTNGGTSWSAVTNGGVYSGALTNTLTITGTTSTMNGYLYRSTGKNNSVNCTSNSAVAALGVGVTPGITSTSSAGGCTGTPTTVSAVPAAGTTTVTWYDQATGGTVLGTGNTLNIASAPASNTNYYAHPSIPPVANSLSVQLSATNSQTGCFMDIKPLKNIKLTDISWMPAATQSYDISIYFKTGTAVGFETNANAWTLLTTKTGLSATQGTLNKITLPTAQVLNAYTTYSILVIRTGTSGAVAYQTVSAVGSIEASNSDIQLMSASGISGLFTGTVFSPRQFSGTVFYETIPCTTTARTQVQLVVNAPPAFTQNPPTRSVCLGSNTTFGITATGASTYQWEYSANNGNTWSNVANGGVYSGASTATLTITGVTAPMNNYQYRCKATCTSTTTSNAGKLTVLMPPSFTLQPVDAKPCLGTNARFATLATGDGTLSYVWQVSSNEGTSWSNVSDNSIYSGSADDTLHISGATAAMNNYKYRCVVEGGCVPNDTTNMATLTVNMPPMVVAEPQSENVCPRGEATFTVNATGVGLTYQWQILSTTWSNVTNSNNNTGATTNTLKVSNVSNALQGNIYRCVINGTCAPPDTTDIAMLNVMDEPTVTASSNTPVCERDPLNLKAAGATTGVTYTWRGPSSFFSSSQDPTMAMPDLTHNGHYVVTATLTSTGCSISDSTPVVIKLKPVKPTVTSNSPLCVNYDIKLFATTNAGATYRWWGPAVFSSSVQNPVRANAASHMSGFYKVEATIDGCTSEPDSVEVNILPAPTVGAFPSPSNMVCVGDTIIFTGVSGNTGSNPAYQWMKNNTEIPGANTLIYKTANLIAGDIIKLRMIPGAGVACNDPIYSVDIPAVIMPYLSPSVTVTANPMGPVWEGLIVTFTANASNAGDAPKYQWKRNGTNINGATSKTWSASNLSDNDMITCEVETDYLCPLATTALSNAVKVDVMVGVNSVKGNAEMSLYPNPNKGSFTLKGNMKADKVQVRIMNAVGQVVYDRQLMVNNGLLQQEIHLGNIVAGMYMLRITGEGEDAAIKFNVVN